MKSTMSLFFILSALSCSIGLVTSVQASIVLDNTRVVYQEGERETSIRMNNGGSGPVIVQSWLDSGDVKEDPSRLKVPFVLMPPLVRIDAGKRQTLRLLYIGGSIPSDRESVYYLNVLELPPKATDAKYNNFLQVALRTRIKVFYRPSKLAGSSVDAPRKLVWSVVKNSGAWSLQCTNPSSYYVSMSEIELVSYGRSIRVGDGMVAPREKLNFALQSWPERGSKVKVSSVDDYGASREILSELSE